MYQQIKNLLVLIFVGLVLSIPIGNYMHVMEHQKNEFPKNIHHQCSDYIHFAVYTQPDLENDFIKDWIEFAQQKEITKDQEIKIYQTPQFVKGIRGPPNC